MFDVGSQRIGLTKMATGMISEKPKLEGGGHGQVRLLTGIVSSHTKIGRIEARPQYSIIIIIIIELNAW